MRGSRAPAGRRAGGDDVLLVGDGTDRGAGGGCIADPLDGAVNDIAIRPGLEVDRAARSTSIIEVDEPCDNHFSGFFSSGEVVAREHLVLQCREERLHGRVIEARSDPAHGLCDVEGRAQCGEVVRRLL